MANPVNPPTKASPRPRPSRKKPVVFRDTGEAETEVEPAVEAPLVALSDGFSFRGIALKELTSSRQAIWTQHRLAVGAPPLELCVNDVNAFMADALRIVWLCSHDSAVWNGLRGNPAVLESAICEWADAVPGESAAEITLLGFRIYAAAVELFGGHG
jgi:hypothetical protein